MRISGWECAFRMIFEAGTKGEYNRICLFEEYRNRCVQYIFDIALSIILCCLLIINCALK